MLRLGAAAVLALAGVVEGQVSAHLPGGENGGYQSRSDMGWRWLSSGKKSPLVAFASTVYPNTTVLTQARHLDVTKTGGLAVAADSIAHPGGGKFVGLAWATHGLQGFALPSSAFTTVHPGTNNVDSLLEITSFVADDSGLPVQRFGHYARSGSTSTPASPFPGYPAALANKADFSVFSWASRVVSAGSTPVYAYDLSGEVLMDHTVGRPATTAFKSTASAAPSDGDWIVGCATPVTSALGGNSTTASSYNLPGGVGQAAANGLIPPYFGSTDTQVVVDMTGNGDMCGPAVDSDGSLRLLFQVRTQAKELIAPKQEGLKWLRNKFFIDLHGGYTDVKIVGKDNSVFYTWPKNNYANTEVASVELCSADDKLDCILLSMPSEYNYGSVTGGEQGRGTAHVFAELTGKTTAEIHVDTKWSDTIGGLITFAIDVRHTKR